MNIELIITTIIVTVGIWIVTRMPFIYIPAGIVFIVYGYMLFNQIGFNV
jgi:hypothetical protein